MYEETRYFRQKSDDVSKTNVQLRLKSMFLASYYGRVYWY